MFTGIITDVAKVRAVKRRKDTRFEFTANLDTSNFKIGGSIACSGTCLTIVECGKNWFAADVSTETLSKTTIGFWEEGTLVNLEQPLKAADELGGHIVSGHVDGVGKVSSSTVDGGSVIYCIDVERGLMKFIAAKGSIAVNGVSLTVNQILADKFCVNIIPHTQLNTSFRVTKIGESVNIEIDMLARYVSRLYEMD